MYSAGGYGSGSGSSYSSVQSYAAHSQLEYIAQQAAPVMHAETAVEVIDMDYRAKKPVEPRYDPKTSYHVSPNWFLNPDRQPVPTIQNTAEIMPLVEETFQALTDKELPKNIKLIVADTQTLRRIHEQTGSKWSDGIQGFSLNRWGKGVSEIFVKEAPMDSLMLTIGHEIGHVLTPALATAQDEEAKAFAFSIAWVETIRQHNIGNIGGNFAEHPAENGVHDVGFTFVKKLMNQGRTAVNVYMELVKRLLTTAPKEIITID